MNTKIDTTDEHSNEPKRIDILFLCRGVGVVDRGAERATKDLANAISAHCNTKILAYGKSESVVTIRQGTNFGFINRLPKLLNQVFEILRISPTNLEGICFAVRAAKVVRRSDPDLVVSTGGPWEIFILRLFRTACSYKIVSIGHGGYRIEKQQVGAVPDCHVTLSKYSEHKLLELGRRVAIKRIPNMINAEIFQGAGRVFVSPSEQYVPVVLVVAAAVEYKNVDLTIRAVADAGYRLIWCGDGPLKNQLIELANSLFRVGDFRWLKVPLKSMPEIYAEADIFTLASRKDLEAYALVYLEAMSSGLRCVSTNDEIRREICGDDGIYIDPSNVKDYANGLKLAWGRTQQIGYLAWDIGRHSEQAVTESFLELFESLVRK